MDRVSLIGNLLHIDNKEGDVEPFRFNQVQAYFNRNKVNRNIILKARQLGMSSSILGDMYIDCILKKHMTCAVVSHETRATQRLLDRVHFYHDTMDEPKPKAGTESRNELSFPELHSSIYVGTAGARAFGRGDTIRKAHLSEIAFYEDGEKLLSGLQDAVPITGELTLESTANGENNVFYETWAKAKEGKSPYKPFFFPWWFGSDYAIGRNSSLSLEQDRGVLEFTPEEQELVNKYKINENQIRWRRWKMGEKGGLFYIEYPENEVDCFITTGDPVFDSSTLSNLANNSYVGTKHEDGWTFWIPPDSERLYTIGVDTAAGVPDGSFSTAVVLDDLDQVCSTLQMRIEPHLFAHKVKKLGMWYNEARLAIERNFTGYTVLSHLLDYTNVYYQRDFTTGKVSNQRGWWTNGQTKDHMISVTQSRLSSLKIWDINLIRQLRSYRFIRMLPVAQTFSDLAMALMIACAVTKLEGSSRGFQGAVKGWAW